MLPLATNRSTAAQKGTMHTLDTFKALAGSARKAALIKMVSVSDPDITMADLMEMDSIAKFAATSESQAILDLAAKLRVKVDALYNPPATQPEAEKKDTPVTTVDFGKLEVAIAAQVEQTVKSNKADLGCNFRDRHPECFAKAEAK